jgi:hypothetical protein
LLFIDGLAKEVKEWANKKDGRGVLGVSILLFADDVIVLAQDRKELQAVLDVVYTYSSRWSFKFKCLKSYIMVFGGSKGMMPKDWIFLGSDRLVFKSVGRYLGVDFLPNLSWKVFLNNLILRARKRMVMVNGAILKGLSVEPSIRAWWGLVRSVLEYGAELTGYCKWKEAEYVQNEVGRRILAVSKSCATVAVRGELGWWSIKARRELLMLRFWARIVRLGDASLMKRIYRQRKEGALRRKKGWCYQIHNLLYELDLGQFWETEEVGEIRKWVSLVHRKLHEREWFMDPYCRGNVEINCLSDS